MKTIMMTGVTGNMGKESLKELLKDENLTMRLLVRPSKKNKQMFKAYADHPRIKVIWGDMMNYEDVCEAVHGSDYVFHLGGMVSPLSDYYPEKTLKVNVTSAQYLVDAVLAQENKDDIKVVYIGSVAEYGDRSTPRHWGRAGDPMLSSAFDAYSKSKCLSEKIFIDSGIKNWVVLRQSGILHPGILGLINPIVFHVPMGGVLEWATVEDSARLIHNVTEDDVPSEFWNRVYNISSGEDYRLSNYEFQAKMYKVLGLPSIEKVYEPQWFALKNFHGMWYEDADVLENYLHFRHNVPVDEYFKNLKSRLPWYYNLAFLAPACLIKTFIKKYAFEEGLGTQSWVGHDEAKMNVYYGSEKAYHAIRSWDDIRPGFMEKNHEKAIADGSDRCLDHGYDESKSIYSLSLAEVEAAAAFRGGKFLGSEASLGTPGVIYEWECEHGHRFKASLEYVLLAGGWCTECGFDPSVNNVTSLNKFTSQIL